MLQGNLSLFISILCILLVLNLMRSDKVENFVNDDKDKKDKKDNKDNKNNKEIDIFKDQIDNSLKQSKMVSGLDDDKTYYTFDNKNEVDVKNFKGVLTSGDLLPNTKEKNEFNEFMIEADFNDSNLLLNGSNKMGENTIGSTRKNASYDIRGTIPCPKFSVSPWLNSTYEPDTNIKSLY